MKIDHGSRIQSGDRNAFELFFKEYYEKLVVYGIRFLNDQADVENIVQEFFVKFWENQTQLDINESLSAYAYRSIRNACLNELKHQKVKSKYINETTHTSTDVYHEDPVEVDELKLKIASAIGVLPDRCRQVFLLSRDEGKRYKEIAQELDISEKTVENQMGKALKILREKLGEFLVVLIAVLNFLFKG